MADLLEMYKPALVIGLGGTGVLTVRHLKAELLGSEARQMPPHVRLVALDTVQEQQSSGLKGEDHTGLAALRTELKPEEYYWIGGDIHNYTRQVAQGDHPHVASWFQAETYLKTLPRAAFVLERGAGQLRQFGRVAIFKDVSAPAQSSIYHLLDTAISDIRGAGYFESIDVYLVSSVVGGTGAGMFVDIAYLVRRIAEVNHGITVTLRGFLVLPEVFQKIPGGVKDAMRARAVASMRENRRFMVDFQWENGYPMYYHASGQDRIWRTTIKHKLFDFLYYIDGQRKNNPLTAVLPELGVTPSMADTIAGMLDRPQEGEEDRYAQHASNVMTQAASEGIASGTIERTAFDSTLGSYTLILPMHHLIESLAYRLALEAMETMLVPSKKDEDNIPSALSKDANAEAPGVRGREASIGFLETPEILLLRGDRKVANTQFLREVLRVATSYGPSNPALVQELSARGVEAWQVHLDPPGDTSEIRAVREQVQEELNRKLADDVPPKQRGESGPEAVQRILRGVETYKGYHLGREDPRTGQRVGGQYRLALDKYAQIHLERFRLMLELECLNILNGGVNPDDPAVTKKGGKLGYLLDFLGGLEELFGLFLKAMNEAHDMRKARGERSAAENTVSATRRDMEQKSSGLFAGRKRDQYIEAEQRLIEVLQVSIVEDVVRELVNHMLDHTKTIHESAETWARTLGIGYDSLYGRLVRGYAQLSDMIQAENQVRVREVLWDKEYRERLYQKYAVELDDGLNALLRSLDWRYERHRVGAREEFRLKLQVTVPEQTEVEQLGLKDQMRNLELLLSPTRDVFQPAWEQESILKYLMDKYPRPEDLVGQIAPKNGTLLKLRGGKVVPANYLHVAFGRDERERSYLERVTSGMASQTRAKGELSALINSADRFRCRLIYTTDLVPLHQIDSYRTSMDVYRTYVEEVEEGRGRMGREVLHVFPAEVNAAKFESRLGELHLPPREFHNDVVLQLEDIDRFRLFVRAWAYGVIHRDRDDVEGGYQNYYCISLPEEQQRSDSVFGTAEEEKLYLTQLSTGDPEMLDALTVFNYVGKDQRPEYYGRIDYQRVKRALDVGRQQTVERMLDEGNPVPSAVEERLDRLSEGDQDRARGLYAELWHLQQMQDTLEEQAQDDQLPAPKRDTAIVFYLALSDDIHSIQIAIDDILQTGRGRL
jgi:hypothetical protein